MKSSRPVGRTLGAPSRAVEQLIAAAAAGGSCPPAHLPESLPGRVRLPCRSSAGSTKYRYHDASIMVRADKRRALRRCILCQGTTLKQTY